MPETPESIPASSQAFWLRWTFRAGLLAIPLTLAAWLGLSIREARESARRMQCYSRFGGIGLALHNYHDEHAQFLAEWNVDAAGSPLLSWRLWTTPYTDDPKVFAAADLTKPWNASANLPLFALRPSSWDCPSQSNPLSEYTRKAGVSGSGTVFSGREVVRFDDVTDGLGSTIYAGEISFPLPWTKPEDVDALKHLSPGDPQGFSGPHRGVPFGFCDGSSKLLSTDIDPDVMRRLMLRSDGETVDPADVR